ncbi:hypothetical protein [Streptomyces sp. NPDC058294]|uniref:hypothetical protein n=1 Tax=Streptomyces sp. NPDC058294 TaxID=3346430 RepID=UPI0036EEF828
MQNKTALPAMLSFHAPDLREQIEAMPEGTALIGIAPPAAPSPSTWTPNPCTSWCTADTGQRLAPKAGPAPKQRWSPQGRVHVVQQGDAHETQAIWMTDADVVNWLTDPDDHES